MVAPSRLRRVGRWVVNEANERIILRGPFLGTKGTVAGWTWDIQSDVSHELASMRVACAPPDATPAGTTTTGWGANAVAFYYPTDPINADDAPYLAAMDALVDEAETLGVYIFPFAGLKTRGGAQVLDPDDTTQSAVAKVALRYAARTHVCIVLHGEPDPLWDDDGLPGTPPVPDNAPWGSTISDEHGWTFKQRLEAMITAVRAVSPDVLIVVPGTMRSRRVDWQLDDPLTLDTNLLFKVHYWWGGNPLPAWRVDQMLAAGWPILIGEIGMGSGMVWEDDAGLVLQWVEENQIGWFAWVMEDDHGLESLIEDDGPTWTPVPVHGEEFVRLMRLESDALAPNRATFTWSPASGADITFEGEYVLTGYEGLGSAPIEQTLVSAPQQHGATRTDTRLGPRTIRLTVAVFGDTEQALWDRKRELVKAFNPLIGDGFLQVVQPDGTTYRIQAVPDGDTPHFGPQKPGMQEALIELTAAYPFWRGPDLPTLILSKDDAINVSNDGDISAPFVVEFNGPSVNPVFVSSSYGPFIRIERTLATGEKITVQTGPGAPSALLQVGIGTPVNALEYVSSDTTFFTLPLLNNTLVYQEDTASTGGYARYTHVNWYLGL